MIDPSALQSFLQALERQVARVHPQKRWTGKIIFYIVRYGTILYIILDLHSTSQDPG